MRYLAGKYHFELPPDHLVTEDQIDSWYSYPAHQDYRHAYRVVHDAMGDAYRQMRQVAEMQGLTVSADRDSAFRIADVAFRLAPLHEKMGFKIGEFFVDDYVANEVGLDETAMKFFRQSGYSHPSGRTYSGEELLALAAAEREEVKAAALPQRPLLG